MEARRGTEAGHWLRETTPSGLLQQTSFNFTSKRSATSSASIVLIDAHQDVINFGALYLEFRPTRPPHAIDAKLQCVSSPASFQRQQTLLRRIHLFRGELHRSQQPVLLSQTLPTVLLLLCMCLPLTRKAISGLELVFQHRASSRMQGTSGARGW